MSVAQKSLIALPVAVVAIAMYAATSPPMDWYDLASIQAESEVALDADGSASQTVMVEVSGEFPGESTVVIELLDEGARRSLRVQGERVRSGVEVSRSVPFDCVELEEREEPVPEENAGGDSDDEPIDQLEPAEIRYPYTRCLLEFELDYEGRREETYTVPMTATFGQWNYGMPEVSNVTVELWTE